MSSDEMDSSVHLETLKSMGMSDEDARESLRRCQNDVANAADYFFSGRLKQDRMESPSEMSQSCSSLPSYQDSFFNPEPSLRKRLPNDCGCIIKPSVIFPILAPFLLVLHKIPQAVQAFYSEAANTLHQQSKDNLPPNGWWCGEKDCLPAKLNPQAALQLQLCRTMAFLSLSNRLYLDNTNVTSAYYKVASAFGDNLLGLSEYECLSRFFSYFSSSPSPLFSRTFLTSYVSTNHQHWGNHAVLQLDAPSYLAPPLSVEDCLQARLFQIDKSVDDWLWMENVADVCSILFTGNNTENSAPVRLNPLLQLGKFIKSNRDQVLQKMKHERVYRDALSRWETSYNKMLGRNISEKDMPTLLDDALLLLKKRNPSLADHVELLKQSVNIRLRSTLAKTEATQQKLSVLYNDVAGDCERHLQAVLLEPSLLFLRVPQNNLMQMNTETNPGEDQQPSTGVHTAPPSDWYQVSFVSNGSLLENDNICDVQRVNFDSVSLTFETHPSFHSRILVYVSLEALCSADPTVPETLRTFIDNDSRLFERELEEQESNSMMAQSKIFEQMQIPVPAENIVQEPSLIDCEPPVASSSQQPKEPTSLKD
ncbi:UBA domain-containing protein Ucp6 [Schizosaccharomyces japonicus yFS275]|uniref:UBA domain-containing protein Ucp6 n=1 Tax=Schizosaccharomyces japonicus (strain yFS275 / FY16936) TaxID=402676 RepID=B6K0E8_SCHJY|nr:UBA domain-containing protein Ucp6 [Schizosaccharomyces japonicus yFS275]EEB06298.1 UBA domain-containing protein Ucp6 [Schizosaccharomyces japonicus yFS275]